MSDADLLADLIHRGERVPAGEYRLPRPMVSARCLQAMARMVWWAIAAVAAAAVAVGVALALQSVLGLAASTLLLARALWGLRQQLRRQRRLHALTA